MLPAAAFCSAARRREVRPAGARTPAPSTSAGSPRRPDARTARAHAHGLSLLPVLALLLGALSAFAAAPAAAQTVWSTTFTPAAGAGYVGCASKTECDAQFGDNSFTIGGTDYHFVTFFRVPGATGPFRMSINTESNTAFQALKLCVGSTNEILPMDIGGALATFNTDPGFAAGDSVSVRVGSSCTQQTTTPTLSPSRSLALGLSEPCAGGIPGHGDGDAVAGAERGCEDSAQYGDGSVQFGDGGGLRYRHPGRTDDRHARVHRAAA